MTTRPEPVKWISQTDQRRITMMGQLIKGGSCIVQLVQNTGGQGWLLYPYGLEGGAVRLTDTDVEQFGRDILQATVMTKWAVSPGGKVHAIEPNDITEADAVGSVQTLCGLRLAAEGLELANSTARRSVRCPSRTSRPPWGC